MDDALDIQHDTDPAEDHGLARRIPHLGHTLLFFALSAFSILVCMLVAFTLVHASSEQTVLQHPVAGAVGQLAGYAITFAVAIPLFPMLWTCSFWQGIHWNARPARLRWARLLLLGFGLSLAAEFAGRFLSSNDSTDLSKLLQTPLSAWLTAIGGTVVAGFVEEVAFRGFLLPSIATAYDWLALDRTPAAIDRWQRTTTHTVPAWAFATLFSSLAFAGLHGAQNHWAIGPLVILFVVSLVFSLVRIRTHSVAASTLVHMAYDGLLFLQMIWVTGGFRHLDKLQ
jgi:membrane protease YdiL (CAAX protease family)